MNKIFWLITAVIMLSIGCSEDKSEVTLPLPRAKVRSILADMYLANAAVELHPSSNKDSLQQIYLTEICKIHQITPEMIARFQKVFKNDLKLKSEIQKEVLDSVNLIPTKKMTTH